MSTFSWIISRFKDFVRHFILTCGHWTQDSQVTQYNAERSACDTRILCAGVVTTKMAFKLVGDQVGAIRQERVYKINDTCTHLSAYFVEKTSD